MGQGEGRREAAERGSVTEWIGKVDGVVNLPVIKTHESAGYSICTKVIVEGGPREGRAEEANLILASGDRIACDVVGLAVIKSFGRWKRLISASPWEMGQVKRAVELGLGARTGQEMELLTASLDCDPAFHILMERAKSVIRRCAGTGSSVEAPDECGGPTPQTTPDNGGAMKKSAMFLAALPLLLLTACVPYYAGTYEPGPVGITVSVPILPPLVVLETRPYYAHGGYYYYWDADRDFWLYSKGRRGPWYRLPPSHYPERFQYRGKWHEGRGRGRGR